MRIYLILLLILAGCGHSRIQYGDRYDRAERKYEQESVQPTSIENKHEQIATIEVDQGEKDESTLNSEITFQSGGQNLEKYTVKNLVNSYSPNELIELSKEVKKEKSKGVKSKQNAGILMLIFGVLLLFGAVMYVMTFDADKVSDASSSCFGGVVLIILYILLGLILGAGALVLIIIGSIMINRYKKGTSKDAK